MGRNLLRRAVLTLACAAALFATAERSSPVVSDEMSAISGIDFADSLSGEAVSVLSGETPGTGGLSAKRVPPETPVAGPGSPLSLGEIDGTIFASDFEKTSLGIGIPENNELVAKFRALYSQGFGYKKLTSILEKAVDYRYYVRAKLAENGLPPCLEYLPVIESEYNPAARSRSGAVGLWQFMANSTAGFLRRDGDVDERYDPWKSTDAAIKKLRSNYEQFGDWALALAAYNSGAGAIKRACEKAVSAGGSDYWNMAEGGFLRSETVNYVPKLLAVADLVMNAGYYGLSFPDFSPGYVPARAPGITNTYRVAPGDTLWKIARANNISLDELAALNNRNVEDVLREGTILHVPIQ